MSLALTQPPGGLTFNPETIEATAAATMAVGEVVHITDSGLIAASPTDVVVTKMESAAAKCGFYGVVTSEITATSSGRIALSGIHECAHLGSGLNDWAAGTPLTVNAAGQLIPCGPPQEGLLIVAYAMEVVDVSAETTGTGKAFMVGGPAITSHSPTS
jgi:hypothetical protein